MKSVKKQSSLQVSVIVVNYNVRDFLQQLLISLKTALTNIRSEIIVVDNASDDGSLEMMRLRFPRIKLIANSSNQGFARANNLAMRQAKGKYFLLINPDAIIQEDTIRSMLKFMEEHQDAGMAGCKILNPDGSFQLPCRRGIPTPWVAFTKIIGLSSLFPSSKLFGRYNVTYESTDETYPVDAISGSFMFLRREVYEKVGGLDESFFMYGEDLDWCYRIRQSAWQVYYVHQTQIIHYKGESTKRSSIDELKAFYEAMYIFVEKHYHSSPILLPLLKTSIGAVSFAAVCTSALRPLIVSLLDWLFINISLLVAEYIRRGIVFGYPPYAYPIVYTVPAVIVIASLYSLGVYTNRKMSITHSSLAVFLGYIIVSALTAFFKEYAFSRMIIGISGIIALFLIPGWRLIAKLINKTIVQKGILGTRTAIVGTNTGASNLLKKLRSHPDRGYEIIGFIGITHRFVGKSFQGLPVIASIDNIGKAIREYQLNDIIFSPNAISYSQILSVISRSRNRPVTFHLVPSTMEVMVGKANVDILKDLPLVQISYNINNLVNRINKRIFDICCAGVLLMTVYPFFAILSTRKEANGFMRSLPMVFMGKKSLVGPSEEFRTTKIRGLDTNSIFLGKIGLTGIVQLQSDRELSQEDIAQYNLYYARNQSMFLDFEILLKTWLKHRSTTRKNPR